MDSRMESQNKIKDYRHMVGKRYRHFKGNTYRVMGFAVHSETSEILVIYVSESNISLEWARPLDMFLSKVDKEKYPDVEQEYRFQEIARG